MSDSRPVILWFRRDLRLADHPAAHHAAGAGRPVIPVFLLDEVVEGQGAAPRMRLGQGVAALGRALERVGSRLVLRRGRAADALARLAEDAGAGAVWWTRLHDPASRARDGAVAEALGARGVEARAFPGHLVAEPEEVRTGSGGVFTVQAPFLKALRRRDSGEALPAPSRLPAPDAWPASDRLEDWRLDAEMRRGGPIVAAWQRPGEEAAQERLEAFLREKLGGYPRARDYPGQDGSSRLSEPLTYGELSPRACWLAAVRALGAGQAAAEGFLRELGWREFCHHLLWHFPRLETEEWRPAWRGFPFAGEDAAGVEAWLRARTGVPLVDAGLREMYVTGRMHNRARMIVASFLCKHLLADWRIGLRHFEDSLTDWDPANNAVNWQWVAGSGPDAAPFFRIFNPLTQGETWDAEGAYVRAWVAEGQDDPPATALSYFDAAPRSWRLSPRDPYPAPVVDLRAGRERALAAFRAHVKPRREAAHTGA